MQKLKLNRGAGYYRQLKQFSRSETFTDLVGLKPRLRLSTAQDIKLKTELGLMGSVKKVRGLFFFHVRIDIRLRLMDQGLTSTGHLGMIQK